MDIKNRLDIEQRLQRMELETSLELSKLRAENQFLTFNVVVIALALILIMLVLMTTN